MKKTRIRTTKKIMAITNQFFASTMIALLLFGLVPIQAFAQTEQVNGSNVTEFTVERFNGYSADVNKLNLPAKFVVKLTDKKNKKWDFNGKTCTESNRQGSKYNNKVDLICSIFVKGVNETGIVTFDLITKSVYHLYNQNRDRLTFGKILISSNTPVADVKATPTAIKEVNLEKLPGTNSQKLNQLIPVSEFVLKNTKDKAWQIVNPNGSTIKNCTEQKREEYSVDIYCVMDKKPSGGYNYEYLTIDLKKNVVSLQNGGAQIWKIIITVAKERAIVYFHPTPGGLSLPEAQTIAVEKGWVIANAAEIEKAWKEQGLNQVAFGMIDDGRFAIPLQKDNVNYNRGTNIGVEGGNQGFFYLKKSTVTRKQKAPVRAINRSALDRRLGYATAAEANKSWEQFYPGSNNTQFQVEKFHQLCNSKTRNPMINGWENNSERELLTNAANAYIGKKRGGTLNVEQFKNELKTNAVTRWEFAPFMLRTYWDALVKIRPTPSETAFRQKFEKWAACDENKIARITLKLWEQHLDRTGRSSDWAKKFGNEAKYPSPFSVFFDTRAGRGTIEGFMPLSNPLFIGDKGQEALGMILTPATANKLPEYNGSPLSIVGEEMSSVALHAGLSTAGFGIVTATAGPSVIAVDLKKAAFDLLTNADLKAKALNESAKEIAEQTGKKVSEVTAKEVTKKQIAKKLGERLLARLLGAKADTIGKKVATTAANQAATKIAGSSGSQVAQRLGSAFLVVGILVTAGEVFGRVVSDAARTDSYDREIKKRASAIDSSFTVAKYLGRNPGQFQKANIFTQLIKMTIADPADLGLLTLELPDPNKLGTYSNLVAESSIKVQHTGAYVSDVTFSYRDEYNRPYDVVKKGRTSGKTDEFSFPVNAKDVRLKITMYTGLAGKASKVVLIDRVLTDAELKNTCFKTVGTTIIGRGLKITPCK